MTALGPTTMRSGRSVCAIRSAPTTTRRPGASIIGDVGGNDYSTAIEEIDHRRDGAPTTGGRTSKRPTAIPPTRPRSTTIRTMDATRRSRLDSSITGRSSRQPTRAAIFFADYTQNWIKRLTFDANGNVTGVFNFEPADGSVDGPYGDIVYLTEGPDGALYYVDLGYSDISGTFGVSKIRRISFVERRPAAGRRRDRRSRPPGPTPLTVNFSSAGSVRSGRQPLTYPVDLRRRQPRRRPIRRTPMRSPVRIRPGSRFPTASTPRSLDADLDQRRQSAGRRRSFARLMALLFRAGDVITFSGTATDAEDGTLPASAYTWNIDFLHEGHVHPGTPITGVTSGTFTIPTSGHDFSGFTRYRITLTVTDSSGLQSDLSRRLPAEGQSHLRYRPPAARSTSTASRTRRRSSTTR